jgi:hypothetical protein
MEDHQINRSIAEVVKLRHTLAPRRQAITMGENVMASIKWIKRRYQKGPALFAHWKLVHT